MDTALIKQAERLWMRVEHQQVLAARRCDRAKRGSEEERKQSKRWKRLDRLSTTTHWRLLRRTGFMGSKRGWVASPYIKR